MSALDEAYKMLDTFTSVGARRFDLTFLDIDGGKRGFRKNQSVPQLLNSLPKLFPGLTARQNSIVVRPHSEGNVAIVQLDDLDGAALDRLKDFAFLTLCTSPGNYQAWVAISGPPDKELARRLRNGTGADISASGATRLTGTTNYKRKYEPDFPTVAIVDAHPGRTVTPERLAELGMFAEPEPARATPLRVSPATGPRSWPDYERCVAGAPPNSGKDGPDISRADFTWCLMALRRGQTVEDTASRLAELSSKARENGDSYASRTAQNAAAAIERERTRSRA